MRSYRTGDMGRLLQNDVIEYCGRNDSNAKVNGQWVDASAIEYALSQMPEIRQAAVIIQSSKGIDACVTAYVVLEPGCALGLPTARERLRDLLPAPAIPTGWSVLDRLPVDENYKVDRRKLACAARAITAIADPPATASLEARLTAICRDVLGLESLDAHDNLFERGADSLALMRINGRLWTLGVGSFPCRRCSRIRPLPRYCERCNRSRETAEEFFG
jgi:hypothetical protein